jgi:SAM-dependent methyltransferase
VKGLARVYGPETWAVYERLDRSLDPRGPDSMLDVAVAYLSPGSAVLDVGCRDGKHLVELVRRTGARGVGIDAVARFPELPEVQFDQGRIEALPYADDEFDLVWCRDMLGNVEPLDTAFAEVARVLRPGGRVLLYSPVATDRLEPVDEALLARSLTLVRASLDEEVVEAAFTGAGLEVERKDVIGTEWREWEEERGRPTSRDLLRLARLRRRRNELVAEFGEDLVGHAEANLHWLMFLLVGKLRPTLWVLRAAPAA